MMKILKKLTVLVMTIVMIVGTMQMSFVSASENTGGKLTHNLTAKQIPYIYCFTNNGTGTKTLNGSDTVIPDGTYNIFLYIKATNIDVDKERSMITVNGKMIRINWDTANNGYYTTASFDIGSTSFNDVNINIAYSYKSEFSVRARKIINSNPSENEMEKNLNENPATYELYNNDQTVMLTGTIDTAISSYTNFVHWKQIKGAGQYITNDDTYVRNLPNGEYTLIETDSGKGMKTQDKTSSSVWLNSSFIKESDGKKYYTFTVNDELVNEWMYACVNEQQASSLFYGFYLENLKTTFNVTYNGNDNSQGMMRNHTNIKENERITLNKNQYVRWGYTFTGWNTVSNPTSDNPGISYGDNTEMTVKEDTVLYAQWKKDLKISHNVYIQDNSKVDENQKLVDSKTSINSTLAYTQDELDAILKENLLTGYKYMKTTIEVKRENSDIWETYESDTEIKDKSQVRYVIIVDKDLEQTTTLSYTVEHWIDGEDTSRDSQVITEKVWINEERTSLNINKIELNNYEGFEFSHYDPEELPETIESGSTINVYYKKIQAPLIPEEPTEPEIPVLPETPIIPVNPIIPSIPETPTIPVDPIVPVVTTPLRPGNNQVVTPNQEDLGNQETETIDDKEVPLASGNQGKGSWALINLICVFATVLVGLLIIILKHNKVEKEDEKANSTQYTENEYTRRRWTKILSIVIAIASIIIFILTENVTLPMIMTDKWTILMVVIVVAQVAIYFVSRNWKQDGQNKNTKVMYNK